MIAHLWEIRADVTLLERGAEQWARVATELSRAADGIVDAARHAMDQGWESEAAERFEQQRRQIVEQIDTFTSVAARIGSSLTAIAGMLTDAQEELDRAWLTVSVVPHEVVGAERMLVLHPASPADEELVRAATASARAVRTRLQDRLYDESAWLRRNTMELGIVRGDLVQAVQGAWPAGVLSGLSTLESIVRGGVDGLRRDEGLPGDASPSAVRGTAQGGAAGAGTGVGATPALPGIAPIAVSMPELTGLSAGALAAGAASLAGGAAARRRSRSEPTPAQTSGMAPMGGMAAGAALRGGAATGRPGGPGRSGGASAKPVLSGEESAEQRAARVEREKEQAREAKRQLIAERQAERAARRARRSESEEAERPPEAKAEIEVVEVAPDDQARPPRG